MFGLLEIRMIQVLLQFFNPKYHKKSISMGGPTCAQHFLLSIITWGAFPNTNQQTKLDSILNIFLNEFRKWFVIVWFVTSDALLSNY